MKRMKRRHNMHKGNDHLMLEVNLASQESFIKPLEEKILRDYIGGLGLGIKILYDEVGPNVDPLSAENILIIAPGPLSGTNAPTSSRTQVVTKSPLTGIIGIGNFGGVWGAKFRRAGFEALLVRNNAESPVYIWIDDGDVQLRSAAHLWGKDSWQTTDILRGEIGADVSVLAIGQAGENLVKFACPIGDKDHAPGRSHAGCVMGVKKLKAIVVRGTKKIFIAEPEKFRASVKEVTHRIDHYPEGGIEERRRLSSSTKSTPIAIRGALPSMNFQQTGLSPDSDIWRAYEVMMENTTQKGAEFGDHCILAKYYGCNLRTDIKKGLYTGLDVGGVGFSLLWITFIGLCGIENSLEMMKCRELCQRYGMDITNPVPFALELFQRGIIDSKDLDLIHARLDGG
jgi:aldehyde:ferredoxin oxidoreductase